MYKKIAIIATLDTKGNEAKFLKEQIERRGHETIVIDTGVIGKPIFSGDVTREEVARKGGKNLRDLVADAERGADRSSATEVMIKGVKKVVGELYSEERIDGIVSLGGGTGTALGTSAMKVLPVCFPKLMVSTYLNANLVGEWDITVMQTPCDILGLNAIMKQTLANAAGAIVGMAEAELPPERAKPLVGITALGVTTPAVMNLIPLLEKRGYDTLSFHSKTEILDKLTEEGKINWIIDLTPRDIIPMLYRQTVPPRDRLGPAYRKGIPQIIVPGGLDMHIFSGKVPPEYEARILHQHSPVITLARTSKEELVKVAEFIVGKANEAKGPVVIAIPLRGFSAVDREGHPFYDSETDKVFAETLKRKVKKNARIAEIDAHINDEKFAEKLVRIFDEINKAYR